MKNDHPSRKHAGAAIRGNLIGDAVVAEAIRPNQNPKPGWIGPVHQTAPPFTRQEPPPPRAFTLTELLIAVALVSLLSLMLFSILDATSKLWKDNEARVDSYREARAALNFIARELSSAHVTDIPGQTTFALNPDTTTVTQTNIAADPEWASRLFLLATLPADAQDPAANRSDLCAVGYFLAFTRDATAFNPNRESGGDAASSSYKLFRYFRSSDPTFQSLTGASPDPLFTANPDVDAEIVAHNVTRFTVRAYNFDPAGGLTEQPTPLNAPPDVLEISLTALNERDAAKLPDQSAWEDHDSNLHLSTARTFTTRVHLPRTAPTPTPAPTP